MVVHRRAGGVRRSSSGLQELRDELIGIAGAVVYEELVSYLDGRERGGVPLPHPVRRTLVAQAL